MRKLVVVMGGSGGIQGKRISIPRMQYAFNEQFSLSCHPSGNVPFVQSAMSD